MLTRKLGEIGSSIYRAVIYPFKRISIECRTNSKMKQRTYTNKGTVLRGRNFIGRGSVLTNTDFGYGSYISSNGDLSNARVGKYCSIGPNLVSVGGSHPVKEFVSIHPAFYARDNASEVSYFDDVIKKMTEEEAKKYDVISGSIYNENKYVDEEKGYYYEIGNDVWIGANVSICQGVTIGDGAVVGTGAVVLKDVEPYAIYAGVPAKKIGTRFSEEEIKSLLEMKWWDKDEAWIKEHASEFRNINTFIKNNNN